MALLRRTWLTPAFFFAAVALHTYGVVSASHIPADVDIVVLPLIIDSPSADGKRSGVLLGRLLRPCKLRVFKHRVLT